MIDIDQAKEQARRVHMQTLRLLLEQSGTQFVLTQSTMSHALGYRDALEAYFCEDMPQSLPVRVGGVVELINTNLERNASLPSPAALVVQSIRTPCNKEDLLSNVTNIDSSEYEKLLKRVGKPLSVHQDLNSQQHKLLQEKLKLELMKDMTGFFKAEIDGVSLEGSASDMNKMFTELFNSKIVGRDGLKKYQANLNNIKSFDQSMIDLDKAMESFDDTDFFDTKSFDQSMKELDQKMSELNKTVFGKLNKPKKPK